MINFHYIVAYYGGERSAVERGDENYGVVHGASLVCLVCHDYGQLVNTRSFPINFLQSTFKFRFVVFPSFANSFHFR